jgi:hypothetical protein
MNRFAEESPKTQKARKKLQKQLDAVDKMITSQALERKAIEIHRWIARHASHRVVLRTKAISIFDENQNAASESQKVAQLVDQIKSANAPSSNPSLKKDLFSIL